MTECDHTHKVCETRLRSLLKGATAKLLEITIDFIVLYLIFGQPEKDLGLAIGLEVFCYVCGFFNERLWNKIQFGRKIIEVLSNRKT